MQKISVPRTAGAVATILILAGVLTSPRPAHAGSEDQQTENDKVRRGFEIAPVPLNLTGRSPVLVGLGSYIVNAQASCNDCHSAGPVTQYLPGKNPFFGQTPGVTNPAVYLGGGHNFGPLVPHSPDIVSRNLTPDKSGRPIGGDTLAKFLHTMRTGLDPDHVHPTCTASSTGPCLPPPFDGELLQIMPWPVLSEMTSRDLLAIYEYLGAIPCVEGGPGEPAKRCQ